MMLLKLKKQIMYKNELRNKLQKIGNLFLKSSMNGGKYTESKIFDSLTAYLNNVTKKILRKKFIMV